MPTPYGWLTTHIPPNCLNFLRYLPTDARDAFQPCMCKVGESKGQSILYRSPNPTRTPNVGYTYLMLPRAYYLRRIHSLDTHSEEALHLISLVFGY